MTDVQQDFTETQYKSITGQIGMNESKGVVECFVAAMGNKDSVGDICLPGCFNASLGRRKPRVVWGHNWNEPIGKVLEIYEVGPNDPRLPAKMKTNGVGGLFAKVQFNLASERGKEAFANVKFFGEEQEWSIGYKTLDAVFDTNKQANLLKEVELYEVSPVLHGANQLTGTISIKADENSKTGQVGPCWAGYKQVGMKKGKNGNMVPNCVPIDGKSKELEDTEIKGDGPCWPGYKKVGMKMGKNGKMVNNCVPINGPAEKSALKNPDGGLTAAGRAHFKKTQGSNLKPGVKGPANTPEKMRRKGSFLTRFFTNPSGPMKDEKGRPTRLALSASAWGEPVPGNTAAAAKLAAKGRRLLERYADTQEKSDETNAQQKNISIYSISGIAENPIIGRMGSLAKALSVHFGGEVAVREADSNVVVFDINKDGKSETMRVSYHTPNESDFMFGTAEAVKVEVIYLPLDGNAVPDSSPIPRSPNMLESEQSQGCSCGGSCGSKGLDLIDWSNFKNGNPGIHMFVKTENMEMFEAANNVGSYHGFEVELLADGFVIPNIDWYEKDAQSAVVSALEGIEQKVFGRLARAGRGSGRRVARAVDPSTFDGDGDGFRGGPDGRDNIPYKKPKVPSMMPPRRVPQEVPEREERPLEIPRRVPKPQTVPEPTRVPTPVKPVPVEPERVPDKVPASGLSGRMRGTPMLSQLRSFESDGSPSGPPSRARAEAIRMIAKRNKMTEAQVLQRLKKEIALERMMRAAQKLRKRKKSLSSVYISVSEGNDISVKTALASNGNEPVLVKVEPGLVMHINQAVSTVSDYHGISIAATDNGINIFGVNEISDESIEAISRAIYASYVDSDISLIDLSESL